MSNPPVPCPLCGYHAPDDPCPHCGGRSERIGAAVANPLHGIVLGAAAVPRGLALLARTPKTKRLLIPPLLLSVVAFVVVLSWAIAKLDAAVSEAVPGELSIAEWVWPWMEESAPGWLAWLWHGLLIGLEWSAERLLGLATSRPLLWLAYFLLASLVAWYCFSVAFEAIAGPFLDEIHARLEGGWFGRDPRDRLERPNDLTGERAARLSTIAGGVGGALAIAALVAGVSLWWILPAVLVPFVVATRVEPRYGAWLRWVASIEGGALWASLKASIVTGVLLVLALPLYFVPYVGYFLFAGVAGFATAVGLLDIPFERRGLALSQRLRFTWRHLPALIAFGVVSGVLLAVPVLGPVLMVPSASIGGLWLLVRLDKTCLRKDAGGRERAG